tara:strand:+ start:27482 stop:27682 length:201 start_codon:yes stop_codon:yes gene_type:complete
VSLDKSLKSKSTLTRARNVLKRAERIEKLKFEDRWVDGQCALGLPKVRVEKISVGKKKKKKKDEED